MEYVIKLGIGLNIAGTIFFFVICSWFMVRNAFEFREFLDSKQPSKSIYRHFVFLILICIPFLMFIKLMATLLIITSDKTVEEKRKLIEKLRIIKG